MARSDVLFVGAMMLTVFSLSQFARHGNKTHLLFAALGCILATTARYMGIFPLAPLWAYVFLKMRWPRRLGDWTAAAGFTLLAWAPISLWLLRNKRITGFLVGMSRETWTELSSSANPLKNLYDILSTLAFDLLGVRVMGVYHVVSSGNFSPHRGVTNILLASFGAALFVGIIFLLVRRQHKVAVETSTTPPPEERTLFELIHLYVLFYVIAMVILWSWGNIDSISTRYVAPIDWAIVILGVAWWARLRNVRGAKPLRMALVSTGVLIFAVNVDKSIRLFGAFPEEQLIQKALAEGGYAWIRNPTWEREGRFAPIIRKLRVDDE
jgi:hypothetical protein